MGLQFGTFGSFTTARLGIYAAQTSLNVTGNNIANMNTKGYTRQRADLVSLYPSGIARYNSSYNQSIGYGVLVDSVSQLRDPFLDIRYRSQNAAAAAFQAKLDGLKQIGHILDEVGKGDDGFGVIEDQLGGFIEMLQSWNNLTSIEQYDNLVRSAAKELCSLFNTAASDLQEVYDNEVNYLEDNVKKANALLNEIRDLNEQIRNANIYGDSALELKDARNVAIDELSSLMKINVTYSMERIDEFTEVEKLTITLPNTSEPTYTKADIERAWNEYTDAYKAKFGDPANPNDPDAPKYMELKDFQKEYMSSNANKNIKLIDGIYGTQINIAKNYKENPNYNPDYADLQKTFSDLSDPNNQAELAKLVEKYVFSPFPGANTNPDYEDALQRLLANDIFQEDYPGFDMYTDYEHQYLTASGDGTDDLDEADFVYDDKFLLSIDPLIDKRGRYMKDPVYGTQLTHSIDLKDTDLSGAIQSIREMLTEEGEFTSMLEMGIGVEGTPAYMAYLDPNAYRAYLAGDPQANVKRGIPYYMKALDNLAQEFARELNQLNQPDRYTGINDQETLSELGDLTLDMIYGTYQPEEGDFADYSLVYRTSGNAFVNTAGDVLHVSIYDDDGNLVGEGPIGPDHVNYANLIKTGDNTYTDNDGNVYSLNDSDVELAQAYVKLLEGAESVTLSDGRTVTLDNGPADKNPTFVDKDGNPIQKVGGGDMTLDDVKLAGQDPLTLIDPYKSMTDQELIDAGYLNEKEYGKLVTQEERDAAMVAAQRKAQAAAIDKAQDNLGILRDVANLTDEWNFYNGGTLISNSNNNNYTTGITAANISVSRDWSNGAVRVLHTRQPNDVITDSNGKRTIVTHTTAGDNITHMIAQLQGQRDFNATNIDANSAATRFYFRGSFQEFFTNLAGTLADDTNETSSLCDVAELQTLDLDNDRMSVSNVDLNEEATNMMQYQKSYSAACQLLTVIDSMLDRLINGTI